MIKFNLNDHVLVKITEHGVEYLKQRHNERNSFYHGAIGDFIPPVVDENGYTKYQLWRLMQDFGPAIFMGGNLPIDTNILIEVKE